MSEAENSLSVVHLILEASFLVQLVMLLLVAASVVSWVMIFQRYQYQRRATEAFTNFEAQFWSGIDLNQLYRQSSSNPESAEGIENIFRAGFKEFNRLTKQVGADSDAVMEGSQRAMRVALAKEEEKLEEHLPFLASVASVSPYIGLFGTVWGIMNSFLGLSNVHQTTLATVAPGIAEALIATAMGLFAAIPAVLAYNKFSARAETLLNHYQTFAEEFSALLHRQVHSK
ncbi:MAG: protein TolQ [Cellvibrio sp.]